MTTLLSSAKDFIADLSRSVLHRRRMSRRRTRVTGWGITEVCETRVLLSTDSAALSLSAVFPSYYKSNPNLAGAAAAGTQSSRLTLYALPQKDGSGTSNSSLAFQATTSVLTNDDIVTIGQLTYTNGAGVHNVSGAPLSITSVRQSSLKLDIGIRTGRSEDSISIKPGLYDMMTNVGMLKIDLLGFAKSAADAPKTEVTVSETSTEVLQIRARFYGIDRDDQISEAIPVPDIDAQWSQSGQVAHRADVDMYKVPVKAGRTLNFDIDTTGTSRLGPRLNLYDRFGVTLANNLGGVAPDEPVGTKSEDAWLKYTPNADGFVYLAVSGMRTQPEPKYAKLYQGAVDGQDNLFAMGSAIWDSRNQTGSYVLTVSDADDQMVESSRMIPAPETNRAVVRGQIVSPGDVNMYAFAVQSAGEIMAFDIDGVNSVVPLRIRIFDRNGQAVVRDPRFDGLRTEATSTEDPALYEGGLKEAYLEYRFMKPGEYFVGISMRDNTSYDASTGLQDRTGSATRRYAYNFQLTRLSQHAKQGSAAIRSVVSLANYPSSMAPELAMIPVSLQTVDGREMKTGVETIVVSHGRASNAERMRSLAVAMQQSVGNASQVVLLDWNTGAANNSPVDAGLQGSMWIRNVAMFVESALEISLGLEGLQVSFIGHSWGTFVCYEAARRVEGQQKAFVAIDPAYEGWNYDESQVNFSAVARHSWSFYGNPNLFLDFGNPGLAATAHEAFRIEFTGSSMQWTASAAHMVPVGLCEQIFAGKMKTLKVSNLMAGIRSGATPNSFGNFEGTFAVSYSPNTNQYLVSSFQMVNPLGKPVVELFDTPWRIRI